MSASSISSCVSSLTPTTELDRQREERRGSNLGLTLKIATTEQASRAESSISVSRTFHTRLSCQLEDCVTLGVQLLLLWNLTGLISSSPDWIATSI